MWPSAVPDGWRLSLLLLLLPRGWILRLLLPKGWHWCWCELHTLSPQVPEVPTLPTASHPLALKLQGPCLLSPIHHSPDVGWQGWLALLQLDSSCQSAILYPLQPWQVWVRSQFVFDPQGNFMIVGFSRNLLQWI